METLVTGIRRLCSGAGKERWNRMQTEYRYILIQGVSEINSEIPWDYLGIQTWPENSVPSKISGCAAAQ
jgi:hypothetical protein